MSLLLDVNQFSQTFLFLSMQSIVCLRVTLVCYCGLGKSLLFVIYKQIWEVPLEREQKNYKQSAKLGLSPSSWNSRND